MAARTQVNGDAGKHLNENFAICGSGPCVPMVMRDPRRVLPDNGGGFPNRRLRPILIEPGGTKPKVVIRAANAEALRVTAGRDTGRDYWNDILNQLHRPKKSSKA
jgi:hypothetical protein